MKLDSIVDALFETKLDFIINRKIRQMARTRGGFLEAGYVYAPYVPLLVTPFIEKGPINKPIFSDFKGIMSRYGKKVINKDYYGVVTIMDLKDV